MPLAWIRLPLFAFIFCIYYIRVAPFGTMMYLKSDIRPISRKGGIPIVGMPPGNYESKWVFLICGSDANYDTSIVE